MREEEKNRRERERKEAGNHGISLASSFLRSLYIVVIAKLKKKIGIYPIKREEREFLCGGNSKGSPLVFPTNFVSKAEACILLGPKWVHG